MIWFNFIFGLALFVALRTTIADIGYASMIKQVAAAASLPSIQSVLANNTHFKQSCARAIKDFAIHMKIWFPLSLGAVITMCLVWFEGYNNGWVISESASFAAALAMTSIYARPWTHPIEIDWLIKWSIGIKATLIATQYQDVVDMLNSACDIPEEELTGEDMVKIHLLLQQKKQLENIIGTLPSLPESGD